MKLAFYHSSSRSTRSPLSRLLSLSQIPHMFSFAYNSFRRCEPRMTRRRCSGDAANWSALTKSIAYSPNMITAKSRTLSLSLSLVRSLSPCTLQAEWGRWLNRTNPLEEWHPQRAIFGSLIPFLCVTLTSTTLGTVWCHLVQDAAAWLPHETPELNECNWNVCTFGSIAGSCCRICIIFNWSSFRLPSGWCFCFIWITFVSVLFSFSPHFFFPPSHILSLYSGHRAELLSFFLRAKSSEIIDKP